MEQITKEHSLEQGRSAPAAVQLEAGIDQQASKMPARRYACYQKLVLGLSPLVVAVFLTACGSQQPQVVPQVSATAERPTPVMATVVPRESPIALPTKTPLPSPSPLPTEATHLPSPSPSPRIEVREPEVETLPSIQIGGALEAVDFEHDKVKILLPDNVIGGEKPLIPEGEVGVFVFELDAGHDITLITVSDILGLPRRGKFRGIGLAVPERGNNVNMTGKEIWQGLVNGWQQNGEGVPQLDAETTQALDQMVVALAQYNDGTLAIAAMNVPNETYTWKDRSGEHQFNPARTISFEVERDVKGMKGMVRGPMLITGDGYIMGKEGRRVAEIEPFEISPPPIIKIKSGGSP